MKYRLLTTAIVSALDRSNPTLRGVVWEPEDVLDVQEAKALANVGYAEESKDEVTAWTPAQRALRDAQDAVEQETGVETDLAELLAGTVDQVEESLAETELTTEQLEALLQLESEGKDRTGVKNAIQQYLDDGAE